MPLDIVMSKKMTMLRGRGGNCQAVLLLYRLFALPAGLAPIGAFALWADFRFALCALAWHPLMAAAQALVPLLFDGLEPHTGQIVYKKGIYRQVKYYLV